MIRILCLEDVEYDAELIRKQLENDGVNFQFDHVTSDKDYTDKLQSRPYDLILSDYYLPGFNGIAALLVSKKICPDVPFICVSGTIGEDLAVEMMQLGASDYIMKDRLSRLPVAIDHALKVAEVNRAHTKAEKELKASKVRYQSLVEDINDVVYEIDSNGVIRYISPAIEMITGYPDNYFTGRPLSDFIYEEDLHDAEQKLADLIQNGSSEATEFRISKNTGELVWLRASSKQIIRDEISFGIRGIAVDITARKLAEEENRNMKESLELLNRKLNDVRENERASIAREIHDQLGQSLTAMKIDADWLQVRLGLNSKEAAKLTEIIGMITDMISDVQRISSELRPAMLDDIGLVPAIEWYILDFEKRAGIKCNLNLSEVQFPDTDKNLVIYRILQEALTNVVRHAYAKNVNILLYNSEDSIVLEVVDDGIGLTKEKIVSYRSLGFVGIRERLKQHQGILKIESSLNKGTSLSVRIPFKSEISGPQPGSL